MFLQGSASLFNADTECKGCQWDCQLGARCTQVQLAQTELHLKGCGTQGRIKHDRMPVGSADPRPDFLAAHRLYPIRAEPLIWLCWHHHKLMDNCTAGAVQHTCWVRHRAAAYHYARKAAALPMPEVRPTCVQPGTSQQGGNLALGREAGRWRFELAMLQTWLWQCPCHECAKT